jgi:hypothetical protein
MQLTPSFILLLGSLFRITLYVYAVPLTRGQTGVVTLALKRTPMRRDLHPEMVRPLIPCVRLIVIQSNSSSTCTMLAGKDALPA